MTKWNSSPAIGVVLTKLVELATRVQRVQTARQAQRDGRVLDLLAKDNEK